MSRPWPGIVLFATLWALFTGGAAAGMWYWAPDFWPIFFSGVIGCLIVPRRWLGLYLLVLSSGLAYMATMFLIHQQQWKGGEGLAIGFGFAALLLLIASISAFRHPNAKTCQSVREL